MKNKLFLRLKDLVQKENRARLAVLLGAAAMLLLLLSELFTPSVKPAAASAAPADESAYRQQLEQQLSDLIAQVEGAGRTTVMITLESGEETIYALDTLTGQTQQQQTHVLLDDGTALAQTVCTPRVCGVAGMRGRGRCPGRRPHHRAGGGAAGCSVQPHLRRAAPGMIFCSYENHEICKEETRMRAITKNTRRVTALTLAAALVVAVYLNWQYARTGIGVDEEAVNVSAVAVEGEPVASPVTDGLMTEAEAVSSANKNYGEAQLVSVANDAGAKFFEEARLKRQKAHDEAMDTIQKTLKTSGLSAEEKKDCTRQMTANLEDLNAENEIETLVKAKGFADCLCFLQSGRADLTVMTSGDALTAAQVAQIRDIVLSKSEVTAQNITVVEVK